MTKTYTDEETGVVVIKNSSDWFSIHLGNKDFELEMSKQEFGALLKIMFEALLDE